MKRTFEEWVWLWVKGPGLAWTCGATMVMCFFSALIDKTTTRAHRGANLVAVVYPDRCELIDRYSVTKPEIEALGATGGVVYDVRAILRHRTGGLFFPVDVTAEHRVWAWRMGGGESATLEHESMIRPVVAEWIRSKRGGGASTALLLEPDGYTRVRWLAWGIAANVAMTLPCAGLWVGMRNVRAWKMAKREATAEVMMARGLCPGCGYDVNGLRDGVCPECGYRLGVALPQGGQDHGTRDGV